MRAWEAKYRDQGLTVIGVHTPEFGFEHDRENVIAAAKDENVEYPIALDNDYAVWRAFANNFWPATYIADAEGRLRYHHYGEREFAMTEMVIQQLLMDAGAEGLDGALVQVGARRPRGRCRLAEPPFTGDVSRQRQDHGLRVTRRPPGRYGARIPRGFRPPTQPMGADRELDDRAACGRPE